MIYSKLNFYKSLMYWIHPYEQIDSNILQNIHIAATRTTTDGNINHPMETQAIKYMVNRRNKWEEAFLFIISFI